MAPSAGYKEIRWLLELKYGNEEAKATAYANWIMEWPCLKGDDVDSFDSFSIMFKTCPNALSGGSQGAKEIDHSRTMKKMLRRYQCPYKTSGLKRCIYIVYLYTTFVFKKIMLQKVIHVRLVSRIKVQLDMGSFNYTLSMIWARAPTYWILKECVGNQTSLYSEYSKSP